MYTLIPTFTAPAAYILFLIYMKISLRNEHSAHRDLNPVYPFIHCSGQDPDWSTWLARAASVMLVMLSAVSIMVLDKSTETFKRQVYDWPADNFFRFTSIYWIVPINWIVLNSHLR